MMFLDKYRRFAIFTFFSGIRKAQYLPLVVLLWVAHFSAASQSPEKKDTILILLSDKQVQLECTQALSDLYNFKFQRAEAEFQDLKVRYGWHPLPYFLMGLIDWWKISG